MKYSLRTLLVTMCGVGAVAGVMGKLLLENPEMFLTVLRLGSTVGPFLLAVATVVWIGLRGAPRGRGLVAWGCVLFLTPILANLAIVLLLPSGNPLQLLSTYRLVSNRLPNQVDAPWVWQELERRLAKGQLNADQADAAVTELIAYMNQTQPKGWNRPLAWQKGFVGAAIQSKLVSDEVLFNFCDAFFGARPIVQPMIGMTWSQPGFRVQAEYGNPWSTDSGLGIVLLWHVKQVQLDGSPIKKVEPVNHTGRHWSGFCWAPLSEGDHDLGHYDEVCG
jgi:hypothetical protein